ncbi:hypothetical protein HKK69_08660 [Bacillus velezensis]|nr:hypothetical protein [Bacillus velezensis]
MSLFFEISDAEYYSKLIQAFPQESLAKAIRTATSLIEQAQELIKRGAGNLDPAEVDKVIEETLTKGIEQSEELTETVVKD